MQAGCVALRMLVGYMLGYGREGLFVEVHFKQSVESYKIDNLRGVQAQFK